MLKTLWNMIYENQLSNYLPSSNVDLYQIVKVGITPFSHFWGKCGAEEQGLDVL